jgi:hypothetical protein
MKRILAVAFIVGYVGALSLGNACHILRHGVASHPLMYFIVWDMFCGWSAFDSRVHLVAEGESGKYYDLTHAPWGEFHPYGYIGRENYDQFQSHTGSIGLNVLRHTQHEPIGRLFVIEECWQKKYNLRDSVWNRRYDDPMDPQKYYRRRVILLPDGTVTHLYNSWVSFQSGQMLMDNPRLVQDSKRDQSLFVFDKNVAPGREVMVDSNPARDRFAPAAPSGN